jgi:hypothetical protein
VTAEELTFGQNKAMEAEMGEECLSCNSVLGKGCLGEYVDLLGAWENIWIYRVLGRIYGPIGCLGEYVDL